MKLALIAVAALLAAACSSDDEKASLDAYSRAFAASIEADQDDEKVKVTSDEALCIGVAVAAEIGLAQLQEEGTPDEIQNRPDNDLAMFALSDARALEIADEYMACIPDFVQQFARLQSAGEVADCVAQRITVDDLRRPTASLIQGDQPGDDEFRAVSVAIEECRALNPDIDAYVDAIAASTLDSASASLGITESEAWCFAENMVSVVGAERLAAVGDPAAFVRSTTVDLSPVGLSEDDLKRVAAGYFDCSDNVAAEFRSLFLTGTGLSGEQLDCVDQLITDEILVAIIAASLGDLAPESAVEGLDTRLEECN